MSKLMDAIDFIGEQFLLLPSTDQATLIVLLMLICACMIAFYKHLFNSK
jgi:hypothetical protein